MELASSVDERRRNGGFPDPPPGLSVRKLIAVDPECGAVTPLRVPAELPARALRRIVCQGCGRQFEPIGVAEDQAAPEPELAPEAQTEDEFDRNAEPVAVAPGHAAVLSSAPLADLFDRVAIAWSEVVDRVAALPRPQLPDWVYDPASRTWRVVSAIAAAALVIGALLLIQGGGEESASPPAATSASKAKPEEGAGGKSGKGKPGGAEFVRESTYALALPEGWKQASGAGGATFFASAPGGNADATLWIEREPDLDFAAFEQRSLDQLEALAGSARVVDRTAAPTVDATIVRLAADAPPGSPKYEVTLRASGPYRYYLATTVQPDASAADADAADLIHGSFQPAGSDE